MPPNKKYTFLYQNTSIISCTVFKFFVRMKWGWHLTCLNKMHSKEVKILLNNRYHNLKGNKSSLVQLKSILREKYFVEDDDLVPFDEMTIEELRAELKLRKLNDRYGGKNGKKPDLVNRFKGYEIPSSPSKMPEITNKILVYGYIRLNETVLEYGLFIPHYLKEIIAAFAKSHGQIMFCLSTREPAALYIANIDNKSSNNRLKAKVINIDISTVIKGRTLTEPTLTAANCIKLPSNIFDSIAEYKRYNKNNFQAVFRMDGTLDYMYLVHKDEIRFEDDSDTSTAFQQSLPHLPALVTDETSLVFDDQYGLIALSDNNLWALSFTSNEYFTQNSWNWNKLDGIPESIQSLSPSCVMVNSADKRKKLFVCGGYEPNLKAAMFDFAENKWISTNSNCKTRHAAICYNEAKQKIFVGGGQRMIAPGRYGRGQILSYDLVKDTWYTLPSTWMDYYRDAFIWYHQYNHNVLFIGSYWDDSLEYIDLRRHKKWQIIRDRYPTYGGVGNRLTDMFGLTNMPSFAFNQYSRRNFANLCLASY